MNSRRKPFRALLLVFAILLLVAFTAMAAIHARNLRWFEMDGFDPAAAATLERLDDLVLRAADFDQDEALRELGVNPRNGYVFRLDDERAAAVSVFPTAEPVSGTSPASPTSAKPPAVPADFNLNFEGDDPYELLSRGCETRLEWGRLNVATGQSALLETSNVLRIDPGDLAAVELSLRTPSGPYLDLFLIRGDENRTIERKSHRVNLVADDAFHTYRVEIETPFDPTEDYQYRAFALALGSLPDTRLEIESIRFISRGERFADAPFGLTEETKANRLRPVLYSRTPGSLAWAIDLPDEENLTFRTGLGVFDAMPVNFTIRVDVPEAPAAGGPPPTATAFHETMQDTGAWNDIHLDLTPWAGRSIRLTLETESDRPNIAFWSSPMIYGPPRERFNIIVVLEDTFRADRASLYGHDRPTTPFKDALAKEGVVFDFALAQATQTRPSLPNILTSLHGSATGVWTQISHDTLPETYLTLPEILRAQGFDTALLSLNVNGGPSANLQHGFDEVQLPWRFSSKRAAPIYNEGAIPWIEARRDRNFFLFVHMLDPHGSYDPPESHRRWFNEIASDPSPSDDPVLERSGSYDPDWDDAPTRNRRLARYDDEIVYNDEEFGRFWDWIRSDGLDRETVFVFLSDHGEYMGEREFWGHEPPTPHLPVAHVPLMMVYPPGLPADRRVAAPAQLIDVMPTLLDLADIPADSLLLSGDSLLPLITASGADASASALADRLIITEELNSRTHSLEEAWAAITWRGSRVIHSANLEPLSIGWRRLLPRYAGIESYDLPLDPREETPLALPGRDPLYQRRISDFLEAFRSRNDAIRDALHAGETTQPIDLDPQAIEQLRNLGYLK